ncbi:hypothetical protein TNCT_446571 [Trichonephila clavata]|uniref:Uncharacterized protein n=1 Tax=Trichonephila clavata TaxID=2740835 RepID=A0A8X6GFS1_TRICU|nr:hypothetical protein TNCT_446571 [Trichonephila clavata]
MHQTANRSTLTTGPSENHPQTQENLEKIPERNGNPWGPRVPVNIWGERKDVTPIWATSMQERDMQTNTISRTSATRVLKIKNKLIAQAIGAMRAPAVDKNFEREKTRNAFATQKANENLNKC